MTLLQIIPITDPRLREPSRAIDVEAGVPLDIRVLSQSMLATCRAVDGAGMAAIQAGHPVRLFVMDLGRVGGDTIVFINPEVTSRSEEMMEMVEGCLSMPGISFPLERHAAVTVSYIDLDGAALEYHATGYGALCCQHEIDHLDGIRAIDRLSPLKRAMVLKKFEAGRRARARQSPPARKIG
jgi:peptide deformylase